MKKIEKIDSRMKNRCVNWDYSQPGTYMITITLANRSNPVLGTLTHCELLKSNRTDIENLPIEDIISQTRFARVQLSNVGKLVYDSWNDIPKTYDKIKILACKVMPDHFHGIIWVTTPLPYHLGEIIRFFKAETTKLYKSYTRGNAPLWSEGFVDSILRTPLAIDSAKDYIKDNPRRLALKAIMPYMFKPSNDITIKNLFPQYPNLLAEFSGLGNKSLLDKTSFFQVQCSRKDFIYKRNENGEIIERNSPLLESNSFLKIKCAMLEAAHKGAVIVSPCISDGEKALARVASEHGFPLIVLCKMGFRELFKPSGELFDLCASGRLLMLAPAKWEYSHKRNSITREKAQILNRIAQLICKNLNIKYNVSDSSCMAACKRS